MRVKIEMDNKEFSKKLKKKDPAITLTHFEKWILKMVLFARKSVGRNNRNFLKRTLAIYFCSFLEKLSTFGGKHIGHLRTGLLFQINY